MQFMTQQGWGWQDTTTSKVSFSMVLPMFALFAVGGARGGVCHALALLRSSGFPQAFVFAAEMTLLESRDMDIGSFNVLK
jgi:hypothetical protein